MMSMYGQLLQLPPNSLQLLHRLLQYQHLTAVSLPLMTQLYICNDGTYA